MSREDPRDVPTRYQRPRSARDVIDEIDRRLAADEVIPIGLAVELMVAMPADERTRWLRTLARVAWRPDNLD